MRRRKFKLQQALFSFCTVNPPKRHESVSLWVLPSHCLQMWGRGVVTITVGGICRVRILTVCWCSFTINALGEGLKRLPLCSKPSESHETNSPHFQSSDHIQMWHTVTVINSEYGIGWQDFNIFYYDWISFKMSSSQTFSPLKNLCSRIVLSGNTQIQ